MTSFFVLILLGVLAAALMLGFVNASPASIANFLRRAGPILLLVLGIGLVLAGRPGIGLPMVMIAGPWAWRQRGVARMKNTGSGKRSTVRSAWLEMELDHDSGDLEGVVLTGELEGTRLSELDEEALLALYADLLGDAESAGLMEAYLDRRVPGWRQDTQGASGSGERHAAGAGPMSKQEAYQILGLAEGATTAEIKAAHRRLMKAVHPDSGGSTFLAARINEAKDLLLN